MSKFDYILTHWFKVKLKKKDKELRLQISNKDKLAIENIYEEYEERKRLKEIKISLLLKDTFNNTTSDDKNNSGDL